MMVEIEIHTDQGEGYFLFDKQRGQKVNHDFLRGRTIEHIEIDKEEVLTLILEEK